MKKVKFIGPDSLVATIEVRDGKFVYGGDAARAEGVARTYAKMLDDDGETDGEDAAKWVLDAIAKRVQGTHL